MWMKICLPCVVPHSTASRQLGLIGNYKSALEVAPISLLFSLHTVSNSDDCFSVNRAFVSPRNVHMRTRKCFPRMNIVYDLET